MWQPELRTNQPVNEKEEKIEGKKVLFPKVLSRFCAKKSAGLLQAQKTAAPRHFPWGNACVADHFHPGICAHFYEDVCRRNRPNCRQKWIRQGGGDGWVFFRLMARSKKLSHQTVWVETSALQQKEGWGDLIQTLSPSPPLSGQPGWCNRFNCTVLSYFHFGLKNCLFFLPVDSH